MSAARLALDQRRRDRRPGFINLRLQPSLVPARGGAGAGRGRPLRRRRRRPATAVAGGVRQRQPDRAGDRGQRPKRRLRRLRWRGCSASPATRSQREYYFNDAGRQVDLFGASLQARARGQEPPEDGYQGDYVTELAAELGLDADAPVEQWTRRGTDAMMAQHQHKPGALPRAVRLLVSGAIAV